MAKVYKRRGKLIQQSCEFCSSHDSQMHHDDYDKPLEVRWLCRRCHLLLHRGQKRPPYIRRPRSDPKLAAIAKKFRDRMGQPDSSNW